MENNLKTNEGKNILNKPLFKGCGTAIITPLDTNGNVDYSEFQKLVDYQIQNNADAIIVCGSTGEAVTLTKEEQKNLIELAVRISRGRVPIIAGTGANIPNEVIESTFTAKKLGADGALIRTPSYIKTSQKGLLEFFSKIALDERINDFPIILYNVPSRTGMNLDPETVADLACLPNVLGIKEASGDLKQIQKIRELCPSSFNIYSGNDDQNLDILKLGGIGAISVIANAYPEIIHNLCTSYFDNNTKTAEDLQNLTIPITNASFLPGQPNPICIKEIMHLLGRTSNCAYRLPLTTPEEKDINKIIDYLTVFLINKKELLGIDNYENDLLQVFKNNFPKIKEGFEL